MMETVTDRVTRYLLARIRRHAVLNLYNSSAVAGLLDERFIDHDEERGTVWTVSDEALHLLTGHQMNDRQLVTQRLRKSMMSGSGLALEFYDVEADRDTVLQVPPHTKPTIANVGAPDADNGADYIAGGLTTAVAGRTSPNKRDVFALVRQHVPAPSVAPVAVALLVARAIGSSLSDIAALRKLMSRPDVYALIKAPVPRFERRFTQMLEDGLLLPYRMKVGDVYHGASLREQQSSDRRTRPRRPVKLLSGRGACHFEHAVLSQHLGDALLDRAIPVIVVDETSIAPSPSLALTADIVFECGGLDHTLLAELLHLTLGIAPTRSLKRMEALALDLEGLSIDDLTLSIRPSHDLETILTTLAALGDRARNRDENDQDEDSDGRRGRSSRETKPKSRNAASKDAGKPSSSLEGVDIIRPLEPPAEKMGAETDVDGMAMSEPSVDMHMHQLRIETLSGYGEGRQWALDLKDDLQVWREGGLGWSEMNTKLLLSGPPGTGKTTYARALCNTLQVPLLVTSVAAWLEPGYLGDVLKRMSQAFEAARSHAPSILFIDEIDNIGSRSGGRREQHDDYWRSLINRLLELLDGASKTEGVIVVAATNLPDRIDPALLRSGRLEKHVNIPMPDTDALSGILAHHLATDLASVLSSAPLRKSIRHLRPPKAKDRDPQQHRKTTGPQNPDHGKGAPQ
ncbi:AAA family ATPase [Pararhizobium sp. PWRC1-1]|uniref:AAA family ATPase n=1 Tax=Pararhizobium sp. PWRC1-1 TaxID=2804566 RepID=UPI003CF4F997